MFTLVLHLFGIIKKIKPRAIFRNLLFKFTVSVTDGNYLVKRVSKTTREIVLRSIHTTPQ